MISKEQWTGIENELAGFYPHMKFKYQGREISINRVKVKEGKYDLAVYVDGYIKGAWTNPKWESFDPIVKDVWRERKKAVYPPKEKARLIKAFGKREAKRVFKNLDEVFISYEPTFTSAKSLVRQFKKLEGLEVIPPDVTESAS
jgi:hypothetical protein